MKKNFFSIVFLYFAMITLSSSCTTKQPEVQQKAVTEEAQSGEGQMVLEGAKAVVPSSPAETPAVKPPVVAETIPASQPPEPAVGGDKLIAAGEWGFSIYDPQTGIVEYYTGNGNFLGKRKI